MVDTRQAIERGLGDENKFQQWNSFHPMDNGRRLEFQLEKVEPTNAEVKPVSQTRYIQVEIGRKKADERRSGFSRLSEQVT